ncbi:hypothetical protein DA469_21355 [Bacillus subtilis]|nr:hypothetical protein DA469_21355 [Bacillus subtilis]
MIITHYDADGKTCLVLAKKYMNGIGSYRICDYSNVDEVVNDYLDAIENWQCTDSVLVITDITISKETAERIESLKHLFNFIMLIDHHPANHYYLKKYEWCLLFKDNTSASKELYQYLKQKGLININDDSYYELINSVNSLETWDYDNENAKIINDLSYNLKTHDFLARFLINPSLTLSKKEKIILGMRQDDIQATIQKVKPIIKGKTCYIFVDRYVTEITEHIFGNFDNVDVLIAINPMNHSISYRSRDARNDVSKVASENGGDGRKTTSGSPISEDAMLKIVDILLKDGAKDYAK